VIKLPPCGKLLYEIIKLGKRPKLDVCIYIGRDAWQYANRNRKNFPESTLVLPAWLPAGDYDWPVKNCDCQIWDTDYSTDEDYIEELVFCLYHNQARRISCIRTLGEIIRYKRDL
jgi:hypothetical protein